MGEGKGGLLMGEGKVCLLMGEEKGGLFTGDWEGGLLMGEGQRKKKGVGCVVIRKVNMKQNHYN